MTLRSNNKAELVNLCKFIKESLTLRNQILNKTNWFLSITFILNISRINLVFSEYLYLFNITTNMNSIHLMFTMYMDVCMHCVRCVSLRAWTCVRACVCVCVCARARVCVCESMSVLESFFSRITVRLTEICSFFISQICKYTWYISLYNLFWDDVLYV